MPIKMPRFFRLFTHETDRQVHAIVEPVREQLKDTAKIAKKQRDLLRKDGVTMQIVIAAGGVRHER